MKLYINIILVNKKKKNFFNNIFKRERFPSYKWYKPYIIRDVLNISYINYINSVII